jgi:hypothetical protein
MISHLLKNLLFLRPCVIRDFVYVLVNNKPAILDNSQPRKQDSQFSVFRTSSPLNSFIFPRISLDDRKREQSTKKCFLNRSKSTEIDLHTLKAYLEKLLAQKPICICSLCIFICFLSVEHSKSVVFYSFNCVASVVDCIRIVNCSTHTGKVARIQRRKQMINKLLLGEVLLLAVGEMAMRLGEEPKDGAALPHLSSDSFFSPCFEINKPLNHV